MLSLMAVAKQMAPGMKLGEAVLVSVPHLPAVPYKGTAHPSASHSTAPARPVPHEPHEPSKPLELPEAEELHKGQ